VADLIDQPDVTNVYIYGYKAYPIRKEVLVDKGKAINKIRPRTYISYLINYSGSNIYRI
jgi:hypothetical protein